jgi:hypothetical protein
MRRDEDEKAQLAALVEGGQWANKREDAPTHVGT